MSCAKCRQAASADPDTWCTGCSAWEALSGELTAPWHSPALRHFASELVIGCVKSVRALRGISSSLHSAGTRRAAVGLNRSGSPAPIARPPGTRLLLPPPPPVPVKEQLEASSYEEESEEETEEDEPVTGTVAKAPPAVPRTSGARSPQRDRDPRITEARSPHREREHQRKREHSEGGGDHTRKKKKKKKRGHRAGRKHPRLYRAIEEPSTRVHRRTPGTHYDRATERSSRAGGHRDHQ